MLVYYLFCYLMKIAVCYVIKLNALTKGSVSLFSWSLTSVRYPLLERIRITSCLESKLEMRSHFRVSWNFLRHTIKIPLGKSSLES